MYNVLAWLFLTKASVLYSLGTSASWHMVSRCSEWALGQWQRDDTGQVTHFPEPHLTTCKKGRHNLAIYLTGFLRGLDEIA